MKAAKKCGSGSSPPASDASLLAAPATPAAATKSKISSNCSRKKASGASQKTPKKSQHSGQAAGSGEQKYYQNFDFYFKRTSFRTMTLYFKTAYKPFFEDWKTFWKVNQS